MKLIEAKACRAWNAITDTYEYAQRLSQTSRCSTLCGYAQTACEQLNSLKRAVLNVAEGTQDQSLVMNKGNFQLVKINNSEDLASAVAEILEELKRWHIYLDPPQLQQPL